MKFFKQHFESGDKSWTNYGFYNEKEITEQGDVRCICFQITDEGYEGVDEYVEPDEVTEISEEEMQRVISILQKVDEHEAKIRELVRPLNKK